MALLRLVSSTAGDIGITRLNREFATKLDSSWRLRNRCDRCTLAAENITRH